MTTARPASRPHGRVLALAAAATLVLSSAAPALGLPTDSTPAPAAPPAPVPGISCPTGQTATLSTQPPVPGKPAAPRPSVTTLPDGSTVTPICVLAPPTPFPSPSVAPEHTVGGARLADSGIVVDKPAGVPDLPPLADVSYVVADMDSGAIVAAKAPHAWLLPASTLKTLTSLVVLPALDPATRVTATDTEVTAEGTRVGMVSGATYTVADLFTGMVLMSGNDTAYALADAYGGKDKTIKDMNALAGRMGAWDTVAVDPSGLDAPGQRSSAYDLALFGRAVMKLAPYRTYATTKDFTFPGGTDHNGKVYAPFGIQNRNPLLDKYPGTIGVKNGYTTGARHTFVGAATRGGRTYLVSEMGGTVNPSWQPSAALLDWAFAYAGQVKPVGSLVDGAPQPPELGGTPAPTTAGTPSPVGPTETPGANGEPIASITAPPTSTSPTAIPGVAAGPVAPGGNPGPLLLTAFTDAARNPLSYLVLVGVLAIGAIAVLGRRRRRGVGRSPGAEG